MRCNIVFQGDSRTFQLIEAGVRHQFSFPYIPHAFEFGRDQFRLFLVGGDLRLIARNLLLELLDALGKLRLLARQRRPTKIEKALFRSEEHTSELQSLMRISYAVFCLKKKKDKTK